MGNESRNKKTRTSDSNGSLNGFSCGDRLLNGKKISRWFETDSNVVVVAQELSYRILRVLNGYEIVVSPANPTRVGKNRIALSELFYYRISEAKFQYLHCNLLFEHSFLDLRSFQCNDCDKSFTDKRSSVPCGWN